MVGGGGRWWEAGPGGVVWELMWGCGWPYLIHATNDLLELGRAIHEGTAPALEETGRWREGRTRATPRPLTPATRRPPPGDVNPQERQGLQAHTWAQTRPSTHDIAGWPSASLPRWGNQGTRPGPLPSCTRGRWGSRR